MYTSCILNLLKTKDKYEKQYLVDIAFFVSLWIKKDQIIGDFLNSIYTISIVI